MQVGEDDRMVGEQRASVAGHRDQVGGGKRPVGGPVAPVAKRVIAVAQPVQCPLFVRKCPQTGTRPTPSALPHPTAVRPEYIPKWLRTGRAGRRGASERDGKETGRCLPGLRTRAFRSAPEDRPARPERLRALRLAPVLVGEEMTAEGVTHRPPRVRPHPRPHPSGFSSHSTLMICQPPSDRTMCR